MTDDDHLVHVSGHPARDELRRLYRLVKPRYAVPVHGEWRHLSAHAALAQEAGATPILLEDGDILSLAPGTAGGRRQRAGRPAGAGRQPAGAAERRGHVGAAADAVQRRGVASLAVDAAGRAASASRGQRARPVRAGRSGDRADRRRVRRRRCGPAGRRCGATMRRWPMRRGRRCAGRWAGGCRSGRWWTCICCGSDRRHELVHRRSCCYVLIWWTVLFAVLPIGTRPVEEADEQAAGAARRSSRGC